MQASMQRRARLVLLAVVLVTGAATLFARGDEDADTVVVGEAILAPSTVVGVVGAGWPGPSCMDTAYSLASWHLTGPFRWFYNPAGTPVPVASTALATLQAASETVATGRNRCGIRDTLPTSQQYAGGTDRAAGISPTGTCTGDDGYSVTSWGTLPLSYLAYTCVYYNSRTGAVISSDLLLDNRVHHWFTTLPPDCANTYDLLSVAVHERGHTAGLAHVDQSGHGIESMSPSTLSCDISERLLGLGDLAGLIRLYTTFG
jgi:hypothetical protein